MMTSSIYVFKFYRHRHSRLSPSCNIIKPRDVNLELNDIHEELIQIRCTIFILILRLI